MLEAVIFDMDGVIVDTEPGYFKSLNAFLKRFGKSIDQKYNERFFGTSNWDMWEYIKEDLRLDDVTVEECVKGMEEEREQLIEKEGYQPIKGTIALIKELHKAGVPLAVASSSGMDEIDRVVDTLKIRSYFKHLVSGLDCENAKPFPDVFLKAARKLEKNPARCLVIEDSNNGALAGKRAGMQVIGFHNPEYGNQALEDADYVVNTIEDINLELCRKIGALNKCD